VAGFDRDFRFIEQKHICAAIKDERRTDVNTETQESKENIYETDTNNSYRIARCCGRQLVWRKRRDNYGYNNKRQRPGLAAPGAHRRE
jgi:hypothetical protein